MWVVGIELKIIRIGSKQVYLSHNPSWLLNNWNIKQLFTICHNAWNITTIWKSKGNTDKWKVSLSEHRHQLNQEHNSVKKIIHQMHYTLQWEKFTSKLFWDTLTLRMSCICTVLRGNESSVLFSLSMFWLILSVWERWRNNSNERPFLISNDHHQLSTLPKWNFCFLFGCACRHMCACMYTFADLCFKSCDFNRWGFNILRDFSN